MASILARPSGRALLEITATDASDSLFQSSPGPRAGRYSRRVTSTGRATIGFNPRPARGPGATSRPPTYGVGSWPFQSSPGPRAGRYHGALVDLHHRRAVSILARPEGRALPVSRSDHVHEDRGVSILARPEGRALLGASRHCAPPDPCFNPRPARGPGATWPAMRASGYSRCCFNPRPARGPGATPRRWHRHAGRVVGVSILARPEGRALPCPRQDRRQRQGVSILARPEGRALRPEDAERVCNHEVSILARPEGRALQDDGPEEPALLTRFNPRPARGPGATSASSWMRDLPRDDVSILARPEGRALHAGAPSRITMHMFQSSPGPRAGRYVAPLTSPRYAVVFQSSPGPRAGRYISPPRA